jgi:predicted MFS family arabinose efflux permease
MTAGIRHYAAITGAYWGFTLTDGALRMLVLLYFHRLGYGALEIASLFLLYEIAGIVTNLLGGFIASRLGLNITLYLGLSLQIIALIMLSFLDKEWSSHFAILWVLISQGLSGTAKDFTKMSAKSAIKLLVPKDSHGLLFKWTSLLTGSKNTLKGAGFFMGGALLSVFGFQVSLYMMAAPLFIILILILAALPKDLGKAKSKSKFKDILSKNSAINRLSLARLFLFGARDIWFVVALPLFMLETLGFSFTQIGAYMAIWVILYGIIQTMTPKIIPQSPDGARREIKSSSRWIMRLSLIPFIIYMGNEYLNLPPLWNILMGLGVFGFVFAVNSALHSYLILSFTDAEKAALDVGFYYMANAAGRLLGTILSGVCYKQGGLEACLIVSSLMLIIAYLISRKIHPQKKIS